MTNQELNTAIIAINKIIASNNPVVAVAALKRNGYQTQFDVLSAAQIEKALIEFYNANPNVYSQIIQQVPYREDITNWTTSPDTKTNIRNIAAQLGLTQSQRGTSGSGGGNQFYGLNLGDLWKQIVGSIGGTATTNPNVITTTTQPVFSTTTIVILVLLAIAAIIFILWDAGIFKRGAAA